MHSQAAIESLSSSLASLRRHHETVERELPLRAEVRLLPISESLQQLQLWWVAVRSPVASEFLWDICPVEGADEAACAAGALAALGVPYRPEAIPSREATPKAAGPMFRYHPMRFRDFNPAAAAMAHFADHSGTTVFSESGLRTATDTIQAMSRHPNAVLLRDRIELRNPRELTHDLIELLLAYGEFHRGGDAIFDLPEELTQRFRQTDVDDIRFESLKLPYPALYLYFGPQKDLSWRPGWCVDGVYVAEVLAGEYLHFTVTCAPADAEIYFRSLSSAEPIYSQPWGSEQLKVPVGLAVDQVLSERIATLKAEMTRTLPIPEGFEGVKDMSRVRAQEELDSLPARQAAWTEALKLMVNGLAYLSAYPDDIEEHWPEGAPEPLLRLATSGTPKERARSRSKLKTMGFTTVHLAGKRFRADAAPSSARSATRSLAGAPTWVRGHWVRQPYGPAHSLRRLHWRMPYVRNAQGETPARGHVYLVDDAATTDARDEPVPPDTA
jgi:hypothetical protein